MKKRYGVVTLVLVMIMVALLGCVGFPTPTPEGQVPIKTAEKPLEDSEAPGEYVVTWRGQVVDALSKEAIQPASVTFLAPEGVFTFEGDFEVAIPANRVTRFRALAPGYRLGMSEIKPHFQRDAEIKGNIELDPWHFGPYADIIEDLESRFPLQRYGRYPQLLESSSWVEIHEEEAILRYRREGDDVWRWTAWDSFELSYGIRAYLLNRYPDLVQDVALCLIERPSVIGEEHTPTQRHVVPWVIFRACPEPCRRDEGVLALDLTPLGADVNPMHIPTKIYVGDEARDEITRQFEAYKAGVSLKQGVPMKVEERGGKTYYVMAAINVLEDEYQFLLQAYEIQPATKESPLEFLQGGLVSMRIAKDAFTEIQDQMRQEDPFVLMTKADLLVREGSRDPDLERVLNGNLDIPYYLITKVQLGPSMPSAFEGGRL